MQYLELQLALKTSVVSLQRFDVGGLRCWVVAAAAAAAAATVAVLL